MKRMFFLLATVGVACSSETRDVVFAPDEQQVVDSGSPEGGEPTFTPGLTPCEGLDCKRVPCEEGITTTLTGKVYDPAGSNPLYNVIVYIPGGTDPNAALPAIADSTQTGIACETCSNVVLNPFAATLTDTKGQFKLENVPVDVNVPLVIQIGKWRRKFNVDISNKCVENKVPDKTLKLPAKGSEGDMPQIAVATGGADALECLLRGVGIDVTEFVPGPDPKGHIHVYNGSGGKLAGAPSATELWTDAASLKKYDLTLLSCEASEHRETKSTMAAMADYLNAGGRVFATHYHYVWFGESPAADIAGVATFTSTASGTESGMHNVNMSFPKGEAFGKWLANVTSAPIGKVKLEQIKDSVVSLKTGVPWITSASGRPRYFSFNTPTTAEPDKQCGRAVFSDLHITGTSGPTQISACAVGPGGLSEQQKALEFFLFDLSACISDDQKPPPVPQ